MEFVACVRSICWTFQSHEITTMFASVPSKSVPSTPTCGISPSTSSNDTMYWYPWRFSANPCWWIFVDALDSPKYGDDNFTVNGAISAISVIENKGPSSWSPSRIQSPTTNSRSSSLGMMVSRPFVAVAVFPTTKSFAELEEIVRDPTPGTDCRLFSNTLVNADASTRIVVSNIDTSKYPPIWDNDDVSIIWTSLNGPSWTSFVYSSLDWM